MAQFVNMAGLLKNPSTTKLGSRQNCPQDIEAAKELYGDWFTAEDLRLVKKSEREAATCAACKGLPCCKPTFKGCRMVVNVDSTSKEVRISFTAACRYEKARRKKSKFKLAKIPQRYIGLTFEDYRQDAGNEKAIRFARWYLDNPTEGLLYYGVPGCGKTMLVSIIAQEVMKLGKSVIFGDVPSLLDDLKRSFSGESVSYETLMGELEKADVLVLDDIGTEYATDWAMTELYKIVNGRYNAGKSILATSNYNAGELIKRLKGNVIGTRIVSRLTQMCKAVQIGGGDKRLVSSR